MISDLFDEVLQIAAARKCVFPSGFKEMTMEKMISPGEANNSMYQDYVAKRPMEVETYLGAALKIAQQVGITLPRIETVYALLHHINIVNQKRPNPADKQMTPPTSAGGPMSHTGGMPPPTQRNMPPPGSRGPMPPHGRATRAPSTNGYGPSNGYAPNGMRPRPGPAQFDGGGDGDGLDQFSHLVMYDTPNGVQSPEHDSMSPQAIALRERELMLREKELAWKEREMQSGQMQGPRPSMGMGSGPGPRPGTAMRGPMPPPGMRGPTGASMGRGMPPLGMRSASGMSMGPGMPMGRGGMGGPPGVRRPLPPGMRSPQMGRDLDEDEEDGEDYFDPTAYRGPPVDPDNVDMMSITSRRTRKQPSNGNLRSGHGGGQGPPRGNPFAQRLPGRNKLNPRMLQDMPGGQGSHDSIMNNALMAYSTDRYGAVGNVGKESRTNSLTAQKLNEMAGSSFGGGYPTMPRRTSHSPADGPSRQGPGQPLPPQHRSSSAAPNGMHGANGI